MAPFGHYTIFDAMMTTKRPLLSFSWFSLPVLSLLAIVAAASSTASSPLVWAPFHDANQAAGPSCRALHTLTIGSFPTRETVGSQTRNTTCAIALLHGGFQFPFQELEGAGTLLYRRSTWILNLNTYLWFDPFAGSILPKERRPDGRGGHTMVFAQIQQNSYFVLFGGTNATALFNDVWRLDVNSNSSGNSCNAWQILARRDNTVWQEMAIDGERPAGRWGHAGVILNNTLVVFGGFSSPLGKCKSRLLSLSLC